MYVRNDINSLITEGMPKESATSVLASGPDSSSGGSGTYVDRSGDTMTGKLTIDSGSVEPPFALGANNQGQEVVGLLSADSSKLGGYAASQYPRKGIANTFTDAQTGTAWITTLAGYVATPSVAYLDNSGVTNYDISATNTSGTLLFDKQGGAATYAVKFSSNLNLGFFGATPVTKTTVADLAAGTASGTYGATEQTMLQAVYDKVNSLLDALQALGLV